MVTGIFIGLIVNSTSGMFFVKFYFFEEEGLKSCEAIFAIANRRSL